MNVNVMDGWMNANDVMCDVMHVMIQNELIYDPRHVLFLSLDRHQFGISLIDLK